MAARDGESINETPRNTNVYLGDADAAEKTTYVGDKHGTDVGRQRDEPVPVTAPVRREGGLGPFGWIAAVLAALALVIYAAGLFG